MVMSAARSPFHPISYLESRKPNVVLSGSKGIRHGMNAVKGVFEAIGHDVKNHQIMGSPHYGKTIAGIKMVVLITIPITIYNFIKSIKGFCQNIAQPTKPSAKSEAIDHALMGLGSAGELLDAAATTASGLEKFITIPAENMTWVTPMTWVALGLMVCFVAYHAKQLWSTNKFHKELKDNLLNKMTSQPERCLENMVVEQSSVGVKRWNKYLATSEGDKIQKKVIADLKAFNAEPSEENRAQLENTRNALNNRVERKKFSHKLSILILIVAIVAVAVLLLVSGPLGTVAYVALFLVAVASISKFFYDRWATKRLRIDLGFVDK